MVLNTDYPTIGYYCKYHLFSIPQLVGTATGWGFSRKLLQLQIQDFCGGGGGWGVGGVYFKVVCEKEIRQ